MTSPAATVAAELVCRLTLLRAMAEHGHLSAAANAVAVPQSTATRWLAELSRAVGVELTRRVGRRIELTNAGQVLADAAGAVQTSLAVGVSRAREAADPESGQIVFGFLRTMGTSRAPELLRGYRAARPRTRMILVQASHEELVGKLHDGTIDVAMSALRPTEPGIEAVELFREHFVVVVPRDHRIACLDSVRLRDCRDETFVGLARGIALRRRVDELFAAAGVRPRYGFETEEVETVRGLATTGVGVAVLPGRHGGPLSGSVEIPVVPRSYRRIGLLVSTRRAPESVVAHFCEWATTQQR
ncbi:LysR family transcriptional regulator [Saccharomonospora sp. NPDC046836]|uniref:LysR family transcriptional regulator n=1 Tax=Saccharomonospora sp. NPDC046836 TaxID=3156921 RepID=UPI0034071985